MRNCSFAVVTIFAGATLFSPPPSAGAAEYVVDPDRSEMVVRLSKAGIASAFAHDHVIHATNFGGRVAWDPERPSDADIRVDVDARSLEVDDPAMRAKYDVGDALDEDTRADISETMNSERQLDVERFPDMSFASREVRATSGGRLEVTGDLTLHGQTNSVTFTTSPEVDGDVLRASAEIPFLQSDYGIEPYRGMLGTVRNRDEAVLIVELVATAAETEDTTEPGDVD